MGYDLQRLRDLHALPAMTDYLRQTYPKLDKPLLSKAMNTGYGVQLVPPALRSLAEHFDPDGWAKRREGDRHTFRSRIQCRLTDEEYKDFTRYYRKDGYATVNDALRALVRKYLDRKICEELIEEERTQREKELWKNITEGVQK